MKKHFLLAGLLALLIASSCNKQVENSQQPEEQPEQMKRPEGEYNEMDTAGIRMLTTAAASIDVYPVRGKHNTGYDRSLDGGSKASWNCDRGYSNSDYVAGDHLGIDIWAAEGTPVAATVSGTLTLVGWSDYSGNKVTIKTSTGWYHFFCHLKSIKSGISNGKTVKAGDIIGYVGKTGTASNGVVHLHYSLYPDGNYNRGINPWSLLYAKELNVCGTTTPTPTIKVLDDFTNGVGHFNTSPTFSGSTTGIATSSTATHYKNGTSTHLQVNLNDNTSVTTPWKVRLLSAEGTPGSNISFSKNGIVKLWLKTSNAASGSTVQVYIDDSDGTEGSATLNVINDGEWHGYVFDLTNFNGVNVSGGNGKIDGANVTLDAIVLNSPNRSGTWTAYIDDVEWQPK
ncbi:M23 family metallopeptidase [Niastella caeni]|uniref:M23 family metallopeptidase n=1 Tax=Niastella caeni TaxID=2569763 RepID=A0A4S8HQD5_9BACT|nr:M23 family metallopeptidase [Niastella caeni]THU37061.1 M23 family metallopeptidase [Niastella caeni]